jgi:hypothetical protein
MKEQDEYPFQLVPHTTKIAIISTKYARLENAAGLCCGYGFIR